MRVVAAAQTQMVLPYEQRRPFVTYLDEFQTYADEHFSEAVEETRKYRLCGWCLPASHSATLTAATAGPTWAPASSMRRAEPSPMIPLARLTGTIVRSAKADLRSRLEWTSTLDHPYPYRAEDGREDLTAPGERVVRGGNYVFDEAPERLTTWNRTVSWRNPATGHRQIGFRCAVYD